MMSDPYKVLGVSPNASNDEVKKAYHDLSRKYHPDSYANNPLANLAEEKFKEVKEAYEQIMKSRQGGGFGSGYSAGSYDSSSSSGDGYGYSDEQDVQMKAVVNFINSGNFRQAINLLNTMNHHDGRWNYCYAVANAGLGNTTEALRHAQMAVSMEPNNMEYKNFLSRLSYTGQSYQSMGMGYGRPTYGTGSLCCDLWCADSCCECMGGDLCSCI